MIYTLVIFTLIFFTNKKPVNYQLLYTIAKEPVHPIR